MAKKQKRKKGRITKSAGRFGVRYGRRIRKLVVAIEEKTHAKHKCPKCERQSVKRKGTGIWKCSKCGFIFTGGTYTPQTPVGITAKRTLKRMEERGFGTGMEISVERDKKL